MPEPTDSERIDDLESAGQVQNARLDRLEAADLVFDERIVALAEEVDGLHGKMEHRATIEQAKGIIMSSMGCGPEAAFAVLVAQSQAENRKLYDIAEEIAGAQTHATKST
jgi:AmiR/NasT family two-component response regulator